MVANWRAILLEFFNWKGPCYSFRMRFGFVLGIGLFLSGCGGPTAHVPTPSQEVAPKIDAIAPKPTQAQNAIAAEAKLSCAQRLNVDPNRSEAIRNRLELDKFPPRMHADAIRRNLERRVPEVQRASEVGFVPPDVWAVYTASTAGDAPKKQTMSVDPDEVHASEHFVLLCDEADGDFVDPPATMENPGWLVELQKLYPSCKAARSFGPNIKDVSYTQTCGFAIHLEKWIPKLQAMAEKKAQALLEKERKERDKEYRAGLITQCGVGHVSSCEKKGCLPVPPPVETHCPGGKRLSDEERIEQERLRERNRPAPKCGCLCGKIEALPASQKCLPKP